MGKFGSASASLRAARVAELAEEAKRMAVARDHFVSHLSSNLDSIASGAEQRPYGMSFARAPHERMSSPTSAEPSGRSGVVFARVGGEGLDYARPEHRRAVDAVLGEAIASTGTAEHGYAALRDAGVQWVNNWNGIGEAPELHALDATAIDVRKSLPLSNRYKFPAPEADHGIIVNGNWRAARVAELAEEAKSLSPAGWGSVAGGSDVEVYPPAAATAHDPPAHARVWDALARKDRAPPSVTFRDVTQHWYAGRPGGIDAAIDNSQRAMRRDGVPFPVDHESRQYGEWSPEDADAPMAVVVRDLPAGAAGRFTPRGIDIAPLTAAADGEHALRNAILEHEATHGLTFTPLVRKGKEREWSANYAHLPFHDSEFPEGIGALLSPDKEYVLRRSEVDPRLAEIRRRYAAFANKDVNTVEDAAAAWEWWRQNQHRFNLGGDQPLASLYPSAFALYDDMPAAAKSILHKRMMQVPAIAAPIAAGGLLEGLRDSREQSR